MPLEAWRANATDTASPTASTARPCGGHGTASNLALVPQPCL